jgi:hypothetical protein
VVLGVANLNHMLPAASYYLPAKAE